MLASASTKNAHKQQNRSARLVGALREHVSSGAYSKNARNNNSTSGGTSAAVSPVLRPTVPDHREFDSVCALLLKCIVRSEDATCDTHTHSSSCFVSETDAMHLESVVAHDALWSMYHSHHAKKKKTADVQDRWRTTERHAALRAAQIVEDVFASHVETTRIPSKSVTWLLASPPAAEDSRIGMSALHHSERAFVHLWRHRSEGVEFVRFFRTAAHTRHALCLPTALTTPHTVAVAHGGCCATVTWLPTDKFTVATEPADIAPSSLTAGLVRDWLMSMGWPIGAPGVSLVGGRESNTLCLVPLQHPTSELLSCRWQLPEVGAVTRARLHSEAEASAADEATLVELLVLRLATSSVFETPPLPVALPRVKSTGASTMKKSEKREASRPAPHGDYAAYISSSVSEFAMSTVFHECQVPLRLLRRVRDTVRLSCAEFSSAAAADQTDSSFNRGTAEPVLRGGFVSIGQKLAQRAAFLLQLLLIEMVARTLKIVLSNAAAEHILPTYRSNVGAAIRRSANSETTASASRESNGSTENRSSSDAAKRLARSASVGSLLAKGPVKPSSNASGVVVTPDVTRSVLELLSTIVARFACAEEDFVANVFLPTFVSKYCDMQSGPGVGRQGDQRHQDLLMSECRDLLRRGKCGGALSFVLRHVGFRLGFNCNEVLERVDRMVSRNILRSSSRLTLGDDSPSLHAVWLHLIRKQVLQLKASGELQSCLTHLAAGASKDTALPAAASVLYWCVTVAHCLAIVGPVHSAAVCEDLLSTSAEWAEFVLSHQSLRARRPAVSAACNKRVAWVCTSELFTRSIVALELHRHIEATASSEFDQLVLTEPARRRQLFVFRAETSSRAELESRQCQRWGSLLQTFQTEHCAALNADEVTLHSARTQPACAQSYCQDPEKPKVVGLPSHNVPSQSIFSQLLTRAAESVTEANSDIMRRAAERSKMKQSKQRLHEVASHTRGGDKKKDTQHEAIGKHSALIDKFERRRNYAVTPPSSIREMDYGARQHDVYSISTDPDASPSVVENDETSTPIHEDVDVDAIEDEDEASFAGSPISQGSNASFAVLNTLNAMSDTGAPLVVVAFDSEDDRLVAEADRHNFCDLIKKAANDNSTPTQNENKGAMAAEAVSLSTSKEAVVVEEGGADVLTEELAHQEESLPTSHSIACPPAHNCLVTPRRAEVAASAAPSGAVSGSCDNSVAAVDQCSSGIDECSAAAPLPCALSCLTEASLVEDAALVKPSESCFLVGRVLVEQILEDSVVACAAVPPESLKRSSDCGPTLESGEAPLGDSDQSQNEVAEKATDVPAVVLTERESCFVDCTRDDGHDTSAVVKTSTEMHDALGADAPQQSAAPTEVLVHIALNCYGGDHAAASTVGGAADASEPYVHTNALEPTENIEPKEEFDEDVTPLCNRTSATLRPTEKQVDNVAEPSCVGDRAPSAPRDDVAETAAVSTSDSNRKGIVLTTTDAANAVHAVVGVDAADAADAADSIDAADATDAAVEKILIAARRPQRGKGGAKAHDAMQSADLLEQFQKVEQIGRGQISERAFQYCRHGGAVHDAYVLGILEHHSHTYSRTVVTAALFEAVREYNIIKANELELSAAIAVPEHTERCAICLAVDEVELPMLDLLALKMQHMRSTVAAEGAEREELKTQHVQEALSAQKFAKKRRQRLDAYYASRMADLDARHRSEEAERNAEDAAAAARARAMHFLHIEGSHDGLRSDVSHITLSDASPGRRHQHSVLPAVEDDLVAKQQRVMMARLDRKQKRNHSPFQNGRMTDVDNRDSSLLRQVEPMYSRLSSGQSSPPPLAPSISSASGATPPKRSPPPRTLKPLLSEEEILKRLAAAEDEYLRKAMPKPKPRSSVHSLPLEKRHM